MKKLLVFLFLLILADIPAKAQQHYKSIFGSQSTSWEFAWYNLSGDHQSKIAVQKDTVVNGLAYKKIVLQGYPVHAGTFQGGLLREDTIAGKVWFKKLYPTWPQFPFDTIEIMLFDYTLSVGDTFDISGNGFGTHHMSPDSLNIVDSIYYKNGLKHIRFVKGYPFVTEQPTFIEGIGSNLGVIWRNYDGGLTRQYLLCSYKNGVKTTYTNQRFSGRCSILGIPEEKIIQQISMYPNPAKDQLFLKLPEGLNVEAITLRNNTGKQIAVLFNAARKGINISALAPGLYHLQVQLSGNNYHSGSFIKTP